MTPVGPAIVVHSLAQAVAALEAAAQAGRPVLLLSAVDAGLSAGAGWWREMVAAARDSVPAAQAVVQAAALLDCGDDAGAAQAALRAGVEAIVFSGPAEIVERLADIARQRGCRVLSGRPGAVLDLGDDFFASPDTVRRRVFAVLRGDSPEIFRSGCRKITR
ncbi:MAG: hypothetical protein AB7H90_14465 [Alphaproteobacteria bacterium]